MRAVNLIPPEERRGQSAPTRAGGLAYVVVAALALVLAAVCGTVLFNKRVADREGEAAALEAQAAETQARAESLASFATFQQVHDARVATVDSLARSRFDWERVMRELAIVLPDHVWLTSLTGTVAPGIELEGGASSPLRESVPGPAIELVGCGRSQRDVARLIAALHDIDGVTRVTAEESKKPDSDVASSPTDAATPSSSDECRTQSSVPKFQVIAAFDAVPPPAAAGAAPPVPPAPTDAATPTSGDGGVADAQQTQADQQAGIEAAEQESEQASGLVPGG